MILLIHTIAVTINTKNSKKMLLKFCTCHIQTIYVPASLMWPSNCVNKFIITVSNVESLFKIPQCFTSKIKCYERKIQFKSESGSKFGENRFESIDGGQPQCFPSSAMSPMLLNSSNCFTLIHFVEPIRPLYWHYLLMH